MGYGWLLICAALLSGVTAYAQMQIPRFTRPPFVWPLRLTLMGIGVAVGYAFASAPSLTTDEPHLLLVVLIGVGLVHAPAAAILALKRARGSARS